MRGGGPVEGVFKAGLSGCTGINFTICIHDSCSIYMKIATILLALEGAGYQ
jgi:hypothetical protein